MWYVFNREDSWMCGWVVANMDEAINQCNRNSELTYCYIG